MNDWLQQFSNWLQQAWVYIPAVLSFITAIGLPSLIQIAKIFSASKIYLSQTKTLIGKFNQTVKIVNQLKDYIDSLKGDWEKFLEDEISYEEKRLDAVYNIKQKKVIEDHILYLNKKLEATRKKEALPEAKEITLEELNSDKKKIKVKVKE